MKTEPQIAPSLLTYEDYCLIPDDGKRYEVIDGVLYVSPSPRYRHQRTSARLFALLDQHVRQTNAGELLYAPFDVVLSEHHVVQPDILFISRERLTILTEDNIQGAPDLVVEILSEGNRRHDEIVKKAIYERFGVGEYWVIDPALESIKIYRMGEQGYLRIAELDKNSGGSLETPLLPGFSYTLKEIFDEKLSGR